MSYTSDTYTKNTQKMEINDIKLQVAAIMGKTDRQVNIPIRMYKMVLNFTAAKIMYMKGYSLIN